VKRLPQADFLFCWEPRGLNTVRVRALLLGEVPGWPRLVAEQSKCCDGSEQCEYGSGLKPRK